MPTAYVTQRPYSTPKKRKFAWLSSLLALCVLLLLVSAFLLRQSRMKPTPEEEDRRPRSKSSPHGSDADDEEDLPADFEDESDGENGPLSLRSGAMNGSGRSALPQSTSDSDSSDEEESEIDPLPQVQQSGEQTVLQSPSHSSSPSAQNNVDDPQDDSFVLVD